MWVALHSDLIHHPKLSRLARYLGVPKPQALGHLAALWCWCAEYAEDGNLTTFDVEEIAEGAMWDGDPAAFISALEKAGFLDTDPDGGRTVHEWESYSGRILKARQAHKEAQARYRAKSEVISRDYHGDITVISRDAPERKGKEGKGMVVEGNGTEPPSAAAAAACSSPLSETELRSLAEEFSKLERDEQGSWLASRPDLGRMAATFQVENERLEDLDAWQPLYYASGLAKAEAAWKEATGRSLNPAERIFLADTLVSVSGDVGVIVAAIKEAAVSAERPGLKLVAAVAGRMAGPDWEPVGAAKTVRLRPTEPTSHVPGRPRALSVSELPEYQPYSQQNDI